MKRQRFATRLMLTWLSLARVVFADTVPPLAAPSRTGQFEVAEVFRHGSHGIDELRQLLLSNDVVDRKTAYLRVEARGDDTAWRLLRVALDRPGLELHAEEELLLARVAGSPSQSAIARSVLVHLAYVAAARLDAKSPQRHLALQIALMALARSEAPEALVSLCRMLQEEGALSASAYSALSSFPPRPLARLFDAVLPRSPNWARLLGQSGDRSAIPVLRRVLLEGTLEMQLAAAAALLELGDTAMLPLVERWKQSPDAPEEFKALAREPPSAESVLIGRELYAFDTRATDAVTNLMSGEAQLGSDLIAPTPPSERHILLTATLLCHFRQCRSPRLPPRHWKTQMSARDPHARFVAAAILSKLAPDMLSGALNRHDPVIEQAVGWSLPYLPDDSPILPLVKAALSASENPSSPYCGALVHASFRNSLTFSQLLRLAFAKGDCAPLAAMAVAERASLQWRLTLISLLDSEHPAMRAATAHGLGRNPAPFASGLLHARYLREGNTLVRRALVRAFSLRASRLGIVELAKTGHLDPDPVVRAWVDRTLRGERIEFQPGDLLGALEDGRHRRSTPMIFSLPQTPEHHTQRGLPRHVCGIDACSVPIVTDPTGQLLVPIGGAAIQLEFSDSQLGGKD
ncbi:MAG TPA: HEAT repeat domain-containing protein [Polyangiaceae bacterium]